MAGELGEILTIAKEAGANFNAIADGEKTIETDVSITKESLLLLLITLVMAFVIIWGLAKVMKPFK